MKTLARIVVLATLAAAFSAFAQESRQINRIKTADPRTIVPKGARASAPIKPVPAQDVEQAVRDIAAAWNTPGLPKYLAPSFYGKDRLVESVNRQLPRDAKLRVLGIQGMQTVAQYYEAERNGPELLVSRVLVSVRTQVEYNDPRTGLKRLEGVNEYQLRVVQQP